MISKNGSTAAIEASGYHGHVAVVEKLLSWGADVNAADVVIRYRVPIYYAVSYFVFPWQTIYDILLYFVVQRGWTALMNASRSGRHDIAAVLLQHGANPNTLDVGS